MLAKLHRKLSQLKKMRILNGSSWMIFSRVIALCWKIVLGLFLSNYFFDFNETLWEAFSLREDGHIIKWFQLNDFHQSYCPFLKNLFWGYFSVTIRLITTNIHGNFFKLETMRILLWNGSSWMIFSRVIALYWKYVSWLFLRNYFLDFNKTSWKASVLRGDVHIINLFWFIMLPKGRSK